jgi:cytochrome P450
VDMNSDVLTDSQPMPSGLPHRDQQPADDGEAPALRLPMTRGRCPFDPPTEYTRLRDEEPVSRLAFPDGSDGWLLSRYEDVRSLLADPRSSSARALASNPIRLMPPEAQELLEIQPGQFIGMDPPEHTRYRRLLTGQFTVRRMNALVPRPAPGIRPRSAPVPGPTTGPGGDESGFRSAAGAFPLAASGCPTRGRAHAR